MLEWVAVSSPGDLPNSGIERRSLTLQVDSLPSEPPGNPIYIYMYTHTHNGAYIKMCVYIK